MIQSSNYVLSVLMEALPADRGRDKSRYDWLRELTKIAVNQRKNRKEMASNRSICACPMTFLFNVDGVSRCAAYTGTQLIFPVLRIGDFFCVFLRYQIVINCVFSHFNWVITQIRSLIKVLVNLNAMRTNFHRRPGDDQKLQG